MGKTLDLHCLDCSIAPARSAFAPPGAPPSAPKCDPELFVRFPIFRYNELLKQLDDDKKNLYNRINSSFKGEAIAVVRKENCSGCFNSIPPQRVIEIRSAQKIFTCQSCGRILIDESLVNTDSE